MERFAVKRKKENPKLKIGLNHGSIEAKMGLKDLLIEGGIPAEDIYIQGLFERISRAFCYYLELNEDVKYKFKIV